MKTIFFDMDGTIANLYGVQGWLDDLEAHNARPYAQAETMLNMNIFARYLNKVQEKGYKIAIISWLARSSTPDYNEEVARVKQKWLSRHLHSVRWDIVHIVEYGTPKETFMLEDNDILFDDEERNRENWRGDAYKPDDIMKILKELAG